MAGRALLRPGTGSDQRGSSAVLYAVTLIDISQSDWVACCMYDTDGAWEADEPVITDEKDIPAGWIVHRLLPE